MKKLLCLITLLNSPFSLNSMQFIKASVEHALGFSYRCGPVAKTSRLKLEDIPLSVQGKIVKNMFLLILDEDKCKYRCSCSDMHADCAQCATNGTYISRCKRLRLNCFDRERLKKHILINVSVGSGAQYIQEFLHTMNVHNARILEKKFDFATMYSVPLQHRNIILTARSRYIFFTDYTQEEYNFLKEIPLLQGRQLNVIPENKAFFVWKAFHKIAIVSALGSSPLVLLTLIISPTIAWIPTTCMFVGGGISIGNCCLLRKCREYNPEGWKPKRVIL